ncbi:uncharacterized protein LACBIDRAFT_333051 [Laccaria bicolor S238N-H82]|uniref:Predicted protein n=1 Tax=Laccaria bicolor (strain S238N-H82 / ATCC MYA-4686) TaxID=486041 RepID=B0DUP4_LACBS|nr:uncharacterized protein LACBIDRAFT_333051 [Laccaria bicolor S238N-H82]EDR01650.1 predicted protein [Laccaria bicolor S238N-H82]|eukprot:XP_001887726.1 predicted protein [Laccaria bicolor S238N-H82]
MASKPISYRAYPIQIDPLPSSLRGEQTSDGEIQEEQRDGFQKGSVRIRDQWSSILWSDQNLIIVVGGIFSWAFVYADGDELGDAKANTREEVLPELNEKEAEEQSNDDESKDKLTEKPPSPKDNWWGWKLKPRNRAALNADPEKGAPGKREERKLVLIGPMYAALATALAASRRKDWASDCRTSDVRSKSDQWSIREEVVSLSNGQVAQSDLYFYGATFSTSSPSSRQKAAQIDNSDTPFAITMAITSTPDKADVRTSWMLKYFRRTTTEGARDYMRRINPSYSASIPRWITPPGIELPRDLLRM